MYCKRGWVCAVNNNDDDREVEALQELLALADAVSFFRAGGVYYEVHCMQNVRNINPGRIQIPDIDRLSDRCGGAGQ